MSESAEPIFLVLQQNDWDTLGRLAREAIRSWLGKITPPSAQDLSEGLQQRAGVFVTLYYDGQLRGCVGTLSDGEALHRAVSRMAVAAAFEDYRFPPLREEEVDRLTIEVSVLSPLREVPSPEHIEIGAHGVVLVHQLARAVFLPKVAVDQGWDRPTMLEHLCRKAGLPVDAWRWPETQLFVFTVAARSFPPHD